jgi:UBA-like domain
MSASLTQAQRAKVESIMEIVGTRNFDFVAATLGRMRWNENEAVNALLVQSIPEPEPEIVEVKAASAQDVRTLCDMGSTKKYAEKALRLNDNNLQRAVEWLLSNPDPNLQSQSQSQSTAMSVSSSTPKVKPKKKRTKRKSRTQSSVEERERLDKMQRMVAEMEEREKEQQQRTAQERMQIAERLRAEAAMKKQRQEDQKKRDRIARKAAAAAKLQQERQERAARRNAIESKLTTVPAALEYLQSLGGTTTAISTCELIVKIVGRIIADPSDDKRRRIKRSAPLVQKCLVRPRGALVILKHLGFTDDDTKDVIIASKQSVGDMSKKIEPLKAFLKANSTPVDKLVAADEKAGIDVESLFFALEQVRDSLSSVISLPTSFDFCSIDTSADPYTKRLAVIPSSLAILKEARFKKNNPDDVFIKVVEPDVSYLELIVIDINAHLGRLGKCQYPFQYLVGCFC